MKINRSLLMTVVLLIAGFTTAMAWNVRLSADYKVSGYKMKAFYNFSKDADAIALVPTSGDFRYRDASNGWFNFGSGGRGADIAIPVSKDDIIVFDCYDTQSKGATINSVTNGTLDATLSATYPTFKISAAADNINVNIGRAGNVMSIAVLSIDNTVATANYKVNYVYDGNVIKTVSSTGAVGSEGVVSKDPIITEDNSAKYVYFSDNSESNKIAANGNTVITVTLSKVEKYNYSIYDSFGTLFVEGSAFNGDKVSCAVSRYVNNEGTLYETAKSGDWYHPSYDVTSENSKFTVEYNATDINNVVFYAEGEDLPGAISGNGNPSRTSMGLTGYGNDLPVTTLTAGNYIFNVHSANGNSAARAVQIKADGNVIAEFTIAGSNNNQDFTSETISLTATSDITISSEGSSSSGIDYLYIIKEEAPKAILDYSAKSSVGNISYAGQLTEGDEITETYAFPRYINVDGTLYETKSVDGKGDYQKTFTFNAENLNQVVEYSATEIKPVFFSEGEDLPGASVAGKVPTRTSMTKMGYGTMEVTTLPAGKYEITVNVSNGNSAERNVKFMNGETELAALVFGTGNVQIKTTEEITLSEETAISVIAEGSSAAGIDYLYIVKTGDYVAPKDYTITYVIDGVNTTATFTEGTAVTPIADPVKEGYEFKGWVPAIPETLTEDITVTAQFEKIIVNYNVTLSAGEGGSVFGEGQFAERSTVTIDAIADDDYDFVGWFSGALLVSKDAYYSFKLTGNTNLTAKFEKKAPATEPMDITVSQIGYNTITPAKNIDIAGSGLKAYIASSASGNTIKLTSVEKLVAGNAYFIAGTASKTYTVTATAEEFDAPVNNYFVPVSETVTIDEKNGAYTNCYLGVDKSGENPGFYMVDGQITIAAGKAYLSAPIENATASIIFEFEDEDATIVINAAADAKIANGAYSIDGMAVKYAKGIIVKDGKKFIVK